MDQDRSPFERTGETRETSCERHGAYTERQLIGKVWTKCPRCQEALLAEREAQEQREAERRARELLVTAAIPVRFVGRDFAGFSAPTPAHEHALSVCRGYAEQFAQHHKQGDGLILAGMPGTGKTHLAAAILQRLLPREVRYATCLDLIRDVRETWRRGSERTERQVLRHLGGLELLVIDEVGVQYGTESEQNVLFDVIDLRYRESRPTIVLTNQDQKGLKALVGDRTFDRLVEVCRWVPFDWPSYRPRARKEALAT